MMRITFVVAALLFTAGCGCSEYRIKLIPEKRMNEEASAVQVDLVWVTEADKDLRLISAEEWFLGKDGKSGRCKNPEYKGRVVTRSVTLEDAQNPSEILLGDRPISPPDNISAEGFAIFALYRSIKKNEGLRAVYPSDAAPEKTCNFSVRLDNKSISISPTQ